MVQLEIAMLHMKMKRRDRTFVRRIAGTVVLLMALPLPSESFGLPRLILLDGTGARVAPPSACITSSASNPKHKLVAGSSSSNNDNGGGGNDNLSASAGERREEERRRRERIKDVIIGQTSAKDGAKDYEIKPELTQRELLGSYTNVEREVRQQTERGLESLRMLQLEDAKVAFDRVYDLKPTAYLWQAGVVLFYLDDVHSAGETFAQNAKRYELRFGEPASEERIWRDACQLKLLTSLPRTDRKDVERRGEPLVPVIPEQDEMSYGYKKERRKVLRIARDLFDASVNNDDSRLILSRAKLRAIAGDVKVARNQPVNRIQMDPKQWKLTSWYYLGLHYDALGNQEESKECMKNALMLSTAGRGNDIVHCLPMIHLARRDWFDDGDVNDGDNNNDNDGRRDIITVQDGMNSAMVDSIRDSVKKMTMSAMQEALKMKQIKFSGSKVELQQRLFDVLLEELGDQGP